MNGRKLSNPYILINLVFICLIQCIFLYSGFFSVNKCSYPIHSDYSAITGKTSISSGLSRSFSEIVRLNFSKAKEYNPFGIRIFFFFIIQFLLRIFITLVLLKASSINKNLITADVTLSVILFIVLFWPFISESVRVVWMLSTIISLTS